MKKKVMLVFIFSITLMVKTIRFVKAEEIKKDKVKKTGRSITRVFVDTDVDIEELIKKIK